MEEYNTVFVQQFILHSVCSHEEPNSTFKYCRIPTILINRLVFDLLMFDYNGENGGNTKYQPSRLVFARNPSAGSPEVPAEIDRPDHGEHETVRYEEIPREGDEIDGGEVVEVARDIQIDRKSVYSSHASGLWVSLSLVT